MNAVSNRATDKRKVRFYLWVATGFFILTTVTMLSDYPGHFGKVVINNFWATLFVTVLNYILFEYSLPFVLKKRRSVLSNILLGVLLLFVHLMFYSYGSYAWRTLGIEMGFYTPFKSYANLSEALQNQMAHSAGSFFIFGIARHIYQFVKLKQSSQQLRIEKQQAELNYLRSQTNPHFLFNTLNNIYSLARDKNDRAPESILRLSKILRFMLYETGGEQIAIEKEIRILDDYIALEKLRYDESLRVEFSHDVEDMRQSIPPLLLIPLVENAFKHGVSETRGRAFVDIQLSVNRRQLTFTVRNSIGAPEEGTKREHIGLSNLRRQLELLFESYSLEAGPGNNEFAAILKINLASHVKNQVHHSGR
jgi:sensor histidine kinase YesM